MNSVFAARSNLRTCTIFPPLPLTLIDGTVNCCVSQSVELQIELPCSLSCVVDFFLTPLDESYTVVLGYSWLQKQNPIIDWQNKTIKLQDQTSKPDQELNQEDPRSRPKKPHIFLVNILNFQHVCKQGGAIEGQIQLTEDSNLLGRSSRVEIVEPNLKGISNEYWQFTKVFSKLKSKQLPPYQPYDLSIQLKEGSLPLFRPIYQLLALELQMLREFLDENIHTRFIWPSWSPCSSPVLFVWKKDRFLRLCIDFWDLNQITCKDRYPIPLLADLLDAPSWARIYTKIDLHSAYHLVCITEDNEWKTIFRTKYSSFK